MEIKLRESNIDQILPLWLAEKPEVQSLGYAIMKANQRMLDLLEKSMVYAGIDKLPEKILDVLAIELRALYYEEDLEIEQKREIIKSTLYIYSKAGTPEAVEQMIEQVFGGGVVEEWFEYGGEPYHFKVDISTIMSKDIDEKFEKLIRRVKNVRSHLDKINIKRSLESKMHIAAWQSSYTIAPLIIDGYLEENEVIANAHGLSGDAGAHTIMPLIADGYLESRKVESMIYGLSGDAGSYSNAPIIE